MLGFLSGFLLYIQTKAKREDWFGKYLPSFLRRSVDFLGSNKFIAGDSVRPELVDYYGHVKQIADSSDQTQINHNDIHGYMIHTSRFSPYKPAVSSTCFSQ